jgi:hypothetical protein
MMNYKKTGKLSVNIFLVYDKELNTRINTDCGLLSCGTV